jgi:hypothetical protein
MNALPEFRSARIHGRTEDELREKLYREKMTDGLPVVLPTPERVEEMLSAAAIAGYDRDLVLGEIGPNMGQAMIEKVAINAVMAGCLPDHLPVVIAAVMALCDPTMDTSEFAVTTHQTAPLLIVNGPAVQEAKIACGFGALGFGHRANLSIGRAVRLCLINLGGLWPGESAMSLLSQPGSIAYCLGEDEAASPFPPLHTSLGFKADTSVVTVACVGAPISVLAAPSPDDSTSWADRILTLLAATIAGLGNNNTSGGLNATVVVVLNPDHARALHVEGYTREKIVAEIIKRAVNPAGLLWRLRGAPPPPNPDAPIPAISSPDKLLVLVAGGPGIYSTVMVPWGGGPHSNARVSREIVFSDACEVELAPA